MKRLSPTLILFILAFLWPVRALHAQSSGRPPNLYFDTQFGLTTSKSKLLLSNDTGTALRYGIGARAGSEGQVEFQLMNETAATTFALNSSSWSAAWQDTSIRYHLGAFYLGALFTRAEIKAKNQGTDAIDAAGSGMGGVLGAAVQIGKGGSLHLDLGTASVTEMKDSLGGTVAIEQRLDIDLGASVAITSKLLDFTFGYRTRNLSIKTDTTYAETSSETYMGLRMSLFF